jgi:transcriptional regulator with XRE-family HTH domain
MSLGGRLKEERERLGMTQAAFRDACGASKTAQFYFETDRQVPGGAYLLAASDAGVDIGYVLVGVRSIFVRGMAIEDRDMLTAIADDFMNLPPEGKAAACDALRRLSHKAIASGSSVHVRRRKPEVDADQQGPSEREEPATQVFHGPVGQAGAGDIVNHAPVTIRQRGK